jgi:hypothetical protein
MSVFTKFIYQQTPSNMRELHPHIRPNDFEGLGRYSDILARKEYRKYIKEYRKLENESLERQHRIMSYKFNNYPESEELDLD